MTISSKIVQFNDSTNRPVCEMPFPFRVITLIYLQNAELSSTSHRSSLRYQTGNKECDNNETAHPIIEYKSMVKLLNFTLKKSSHIRFIRDLYKAKSDTSVTPYVRLTSIPTKLRRKCFSRERHN